VSHVLSARGHQSIGKNYGTATGEKVVQEGPRNVSFVSKGYVTIVILMFYCCVDVLCRLEEMKDVTSNFVITALP
jgi:hypothetical protein